VDLLGPGVDILTAATPWMIARKGMRAAMEALKPTEDDVAAPLTWSVYDNMFENRERLMISTSGTSLATPVVAGLLAVIKARFKPDVLLDNFATVYPDTRVNDAVKASMRTERDYVNGVSLLKPKKDYTLATSALDVWTVSSIDRPACGSTSKSAQLTPWWLADVGRVAVEASRPPTCPSCEGDACMIKPGTNPWNCGCEQQAIDSTTDVLDALGFMFSRAYQAWYHYDKGFGTNSDWVDMRTCADDVGTVSTAFQSLLDQLKLTNEDDEPGMNSLSNAASTFFTSYDNLENAIKQNAATATYCPTWSEANQMGYQAAMEASTECNGPDDSSCDCGCVAVFSEYRCFDSRDPFERFDEAKCVWKNGPQPLFHDAPLDPFTPGFHRGGHGAWEGKLWSQEQRVRYYMGMYNNGATRSIAYYAGEMPSGSGDSTPQGSSVLSAAMPLYADMPSFESLSNTILEKTATFTKHGGGDSEIDYYCTSVEAVHEAWLEPLTDPREWLGSVSADITDTGAIFREDSQTWEIGPPEDLIHAWNGFDLSFFGNSTDTDSRGWKLLGKDPMPQQVAVEGSFGVKSPTRTTPDALKWTTLDYPEDLTADGKAAYNELRFSAKVPVWSLRVAVPPGCYSFSVQHNNAQLASGAGRMEGERKRLDFGRFRFYHSVSRLEQQYDALSCNEQGEEFAGLSGASCSTLADDYGCSTKLQSLRAVKANTENILLEDPLATVRDVCPCKCESAPFSTCDSHTDCGSDEFCASECETFRCADGDTEDCGRPCKSGDKGFCQPLSACRDSATGAYGGTTCTGESTSTSDGILLSHNRPAVFRNGGSYEDSSTCHDYSARRVTDGTLVGPQHYAKSKTTSSENWIRIDLGAQSHVTRVVVHNVVHQHSMRQRLNGAVILVSDVSSYGSNWKTKAACETGFYPLLGSLSAQERKCNDHGRYVFIMRPNGGAQHVNLHEVQVYGTYDGDTPADASPYDPASNTWTAQCLEDLAEAAAVAEAAKAAEAAAEAAKAAEAEAADDRPQ